MGRISRALFNQYCETAVELLRKPRPRSWYDPVMFEFLEWWTQYSVLASCEDNDNELGLIAEREVLRYLSERVTVLNGLKVPWGFKDYLNFRRLHKAGVDIFEQLKSL